MKFPLSIINISDHQDYIYDLLTSEETVIFIDTNIIALLYRLNGKSRDEFFNWINSYINNDKIKVPNWVVNEYTNKFIRGNATDYLSPLNALKRISNEYNNIFDFLNLHIDDDTLAENKTKANKYSSIDEVKNDISELKNLLKKMEFLTTKDAKYTQKIHLKIEALLNNCHIDTDLNAIFNQLSISSKFRYDHKFPPGFQDAGKSMNDCGDLIIWNEILSYSKRFKKSNVLFLTNDAKNDWVYAPFRIIENGVSRNNNEPYKIIDPRLVHEFFINTGSENIEIISFANLIKILIQKLPGNFIEIGIALQLINTLENPTKKSQISESEIIDENEIERSEIDSNVSSEEIELQKDESAFVHNTHQEILLDDIALQDKYIDLSNENNFLTKTILDLKSYNWYTQNAAIEKFLSDIKNFNFNYTKDEQSFLFVVGRNIYQAACGSSASAIDFLTKNLDDFITRNNKYLVNRVVSGILYEIYFNSKNKFRTDNLKAQYINELDVIEDNPYLSMSKKFITDKLEPYLSYLIYVPFAEDNVKMIVTVDENLHEVDEYIFGKIKYNKIKNITYDGHELLTVDDENIIMLYQTEFTKVGIHSMICKSYAIPSKKLDLKFHNVKDEYKIVFNGLHLKKNFKQI